MAQLSHPKQKKNWFKLHHGHFFVLPYSFFLLVFGLAPGLYVLLLTLASFEEGRPQLFQAELTNYIAAISDSRFLPAFQNVFQFLLISIPFGIIGVTALALFLHARDDKFGAGMRTLYFVPGAVVGAPAVLLSMFMFDPNISPFGPLLQAMGFSVLHRVVVPENLPLLFTLIGFFAGSGGWIAIFYGALNSISKETVEAAVIDGCNEWQLALFIKRPIIMPYILYMLLLVFAINIQVFVEPELFLASRLVNMNPYWSPNQVAYSFAFRFGQFGISAVISLMMLLAGLFGAYLVIRYTKIFRI